MKLLDFFNESTIHAKRLIELHDALDFSDLRTRSEWRNKLFEKDIVPWGKRQGVWRSINTDKNILILGAEAQQSFQENIKIQRAMLLEYALVMMLAAIDKMLHEATTSRNFAELLKSEKLDDFIKNFPVSEAYSIAMESRKRRGHGGKKKSRPAMKIKEAVSAKLYELSFLGTNHLEKICAAKGVSKIFSKYATHMGRKSAKPLRDQWSLICKRRNAIVHECNIKRTKKSPKIIRFDLVTSTELRKNIDFAEKFGKFLAG